MDDLDWRLVNELERFGWQGADVLITKLGVARRTVYRRLRELRQRGIIRIVALPHPSLHGHRAWAEIGLVVQAPSLALLVSALIESPQVYSVAFAAGEFDLLIGVVSDSLEELALFLNHQLTSVKGVTRVEIMQLLHPRKFFSLPQAQLERSVADLTLLQDEPDEIDTRILTLLQGDGLLTASEVGSRMGVAPNLVRRRMRDLLDRGAFGFQALLNPEVLDVVWVDIGLNVGSEFGEREIARILQEPAVYYLSECVGRFNYLIGARFRGFEHLNRFARVELSSLRGVLSVGSIPFGRPLKYHGVIWHNAARTPSEPDRMPPESASARV